MSKAESITSSRSLGGDKHDLSPTTQTKEDANDKATNMNKDFPPEVHTGGEKAASIGSTLGGDQHDISPTTQTKGDANNKATNMNEDFSPEDLTEMEKRKQSLLELSIDCGCQHQMHRLAQAYFLKRETWLFFLPLTFLTLASGTLAFMGTSAFFKDDMKEYFSLSVGVCSILSVAIQSCAKHSKYAARSEMHRTVALGMKKLRDNIHFNQIDPESGITEKRNEIEIDKNDPDKAGSLSVTSFPEKIEAHRMVYQQVLESCDSTIPVSVVQGFTLVDTRLTLALNSNKTQKRFGEVLDLRDVNAKSMIFAATYNELYSEFSNSFLWPWFTLKPHDAVNRAIARVHRAYFQGNDFFCDKYDVDEDIGILCFRTFCCCMDPTSCFWSSCRAKKTRSSSKDIAPDKSKEEEEEKGKA
jgi:hypothetical protein